MKAYRGRRVIVDSFLNSALNGNNAQCNALLLYPRKNKIPGTLRMGGWVKPQNRPVHFGEEKNFLPL